MRRRKKKSKTAAHFVTAKIVPITKKKCKESGDKFKIYVEFVALLQFCVSR